MGHQEFDPPWLKPMLKAEYFVTFHLLQDSNKNECNMFCLDCYTSNALCSCCLTHHKDHRVVRIRRCSYQNVVRVSEIERYLDITCVQTNIINSAKILFLNERPQRRPRKGVANHCEICGQGRVHAFRFCSLGYMLGGMKHGQDGYEPDYPLIPKKAQKRRLCYGHEFGDGVHQSDYKRRDPVWCALCSGESEFITPDLEEYWVPVHLSSMQIKQYCSILASNSEALNSLSRKSSLSSVITQIQKCCDHPYLVDPTLRNSPKDASLIDDPLAAEINVSGKLHVFDKLLLEIKRCGLRALVLFHSATNSGKISTRHILDDLVHQRFGRNSYVCIPGKKK
ncbi:uncharacterized protein LOC143574221 [Bidens hawaiensis]|uniref:uncharacterized protein LOC143574221 n=1 Tax=Bidens hawaiensis TaxID=980011 RepID=UPI00404A06F3